MGEISLKGLRFKAYHGYYDEEQHKGNHFIVDVTLQTDFSNLSDDQLSGTVDYELVYQVIQKEMQVTSKLLESVVLRCVDQLLESFPQVNKVYVALSKMNPPIGGPCDAAIVSLTKER